jgi:hypothetical protein|tara:strand:+ start:383 stop:547 length:165 start_codon:yes stop_codon:yes gene_type:complete
MEALTSNSYCKSCELLERQDLLISSQASFEEGSETIPLGSTTKWLEAQETLSGL